jgi:glutamate 5-kinase
MEFYILIHDKTPETTVVKDLRSLEKEIGDFKSSQGSGMQSKIEAAAIAKAANIETCEWFK